MCACGVGHYGLDGFEVGGGTDEQPGCAVAQLGVEFGHYAMPGKQGGGGGCSVQ